MAAMNVGDLALAELDRSQVSKIHLKVGFFAGLGAFLDGFDYAVIAIALIGIIPTFHPSPTQIATLVAAAYAGGALGGIVFGTLADRFGRKLLFLLDIAFFIIFAALSGIATSVAMLIALRFFLGMGLGGDFPLSASYISEFAPKAVRGKLSSWVGSFWWVGAFCAMLVGAAFYTFLPPADSWRYVLAFGTLPAIAALWLRAGLPESPRWYLAHGQTEKALKVIQRSNPLFTLDQLQAYSAGIGGPAHDSRPKFSDLFSREIVRSTVFTSSFFACYTLAFYAVTIYGPVLLKNLGGYTSPVQLALGSAFYFLWAIIGSYSNVALVDKIGRKTCLLVSFAGMATILVLLSIVYPPTFYEGLMLLAAFQFFQTFGAGTLWASYIPELFPTRLRASGHGMATLVSRLGAVASSFIWIAAVSAYGLRGAFLVHGSFAVVGIVVTLWLGTETKGRSLEEINDREVVPTFEARTRATL